jgi:hypothetical protein
LKQKDFRWSAQRLTSACVWRKQSNGKPPLPPQAIGALLELTREQMQQQASLNFSECGHPLLNCFFQGGPTVTLDQMMKAFSKMVRKQPSGGRHAIYSLMFSSITDQCGEAAVDHARYPLLRLFRRLRLRRRRRRSTCRSRRRSSRPKWSRCSPARSHGVL